jgi:hypothetical protein
MGFPREDQRRVFVLCSDRDVTVVWNYSPTSFLYHATRDGLKAVCGAQTVLQEEEPGMGAFDRSKNVMTCRKCTGLVARTMRVIVWNSGGP